MLKRDCLKLKFECLFKIRASPLLLRSLNLTILTWNLTHLSMKLANSGIKRHNWKILKTKISKTTHQLHNSRFATSLSRSNVRSRSAKAQARKRFASVTLRFRRFATDPDLKFAKSSMRPRAPPSMWITAETMTQTTTNLWEKQAAKSYRWKSAGKAASPSLELKNAETRR